MKANLKVLLLSLGMILSSVSTITAVTAQIPNNTSPKNSLTVRQHHFIQASTKQVKNREWKAFFSS